MNGKDIYDSTHDAVKFIGSARKAARKMATRYNQKKQAYVSSTAQLHKTGNLDMSRIARYKVSDEIFDKKIVTNSGKSHGLVCAVDFSWSMDSLLIPMAKQLLILSLFCKYAKIKFQFFSFAGSSKSYNKKGFNLYGGSIAEFNNIGTDSMSEADILEVFYEIYTLGVLECRLKPHESIPSSYKKYLYGKYVLGSTPLLAAQYQAFLLAKHMQNSGVQNVTSIIINDGDNNELLVDDSDSPINSIEDPYTKRLYYDESLDERNIMSLINKMSRDHKINTLNLFLGNALQSMSQTDELSKIIENYQKSMPMVNTLSLNAIRSEVVANHIDKFHKNKLIDIKNLSYYNNVYITDASIYNIEGEYSNLNKINKLGQLLSDELTKDFKVV